MIYTQLSVRLAADSITYLKNLFSGTSLEVYPENFTVTLLTATSQAKILAEPHLLYRARATELKPWYDAATRSTSLLISLDSPGLTARVQELSMNGIRSAFFEPGTYYPYITVVQHLPAMAPTVRRAVNSFAHSFPLTEELYLTGEYIEAVNLDAPINYDYYVAKRREGLGIFASY